LWYSFPHGRATPPASPRAIAATDLLSRNRHRVRLSGRINRELDEISLARFFIVSDETRRRIFSVGRSDVAVDLIDRFDCFDAFQPGVKAGFATFGLTVIDDGTDGFQVLTAERVF